MPRDSRSDALSSSAAVVPDRDWSRELVNHIPDGLVLLTAVRPFTEPVVTFANDAFTAIAERSPADVVGQSLLHLRVAPQDEHLLRAARFFLQTRRPFACDVTLDLGEGRTRRVTITARSFRQQEHVGLHDHWAVFVRDITAEYEHVTALENAALFDVLTGLPNRTLLSDRLHQALLQAQRPQHAVAVLLLDIDDFSDINDTLGHAIGDGILRRVGEVVAAHVRACDTVARVAGDEFAVLLPISTGIDGAVRTAQRLLEVIRAPIEIGGDLLEVSASIGVALSPDHGDDAATLLRHAHVAMQLAKESRSGFALYDTDKNRHSPCRLLLLRELHQALENRQITALFQPKIALRDGKIKGVEALARWQHPVRGEMQPFDFIPLSEKTGLIRSLTHAVLQTSLAACRRWRDAGFDLGVSVNLSPFVLKHPDFTSMVKGLLGEAAVDASALTLEITENSLIEEPELSIAILRDLRALGVQLSIDDFGIGYSSLSYLRDLPVTEIKIDKTFVQGMIRNPSDAAIVAATISLCHNLDRVVVAEGVEDRQTLVRLRELDCDFAQGFWLGRPVSADQVLRTTETDFESAFEAGHS